jgi:hypothetical protein
MPKIPTYTAQGRPTAEVGAIKSTSQISPTGGVAGALLPAADQVAEFALKKRNLAEKTKSIEIANQIKGDIDKIIHQNKDNIDEADSINQLQKTYQSSKDIALLSIKNKRVKERVNNLLNIDYSEYVNTVKNNSYIALETQTLKNTNDTLNDIISKYSTSDNPITKSKYISQGKAIIENLAQDFNFPKSKLDEEVKKFNKNILTGDFLQIVNKEEDLENMSKLDSAYKDVLNNEEFAALSFNAVQNKINELTIIGDENADFDRAEDLIDEYETIKRDNGFTPSKVLDKEISALKEKINTEAQRHDNLMGAQEDTKEVKGYADDQREAVAREIANPYGDPDYESTTIANEVRNEYDQRFKDFIRNNPYASKPEKKAYAFELGALLKDKYEEIEFSKLRTFDMKNGNKFNIVREYNDVLNDAELFAGGTLDSNLYNKYKTIAKLNGYVDEKTKKVTDESLAQFFDEYTDILEKRQGE